MATPFNVVCLKWGNKYSARYVNTLYNMVMRHTTVPIRFVCFTDDATGLKEGIETKPLLSDNLDGWWNKVSFFKEEVGDLTGDIMFFDLDIIILSNIDHLFTEQSEEKFLSVPDFARPLKTYNTSVFRLKVGSCTEVYERLNHRTMKRFHGDQDYITDVLYPDGRHLAHVFDDSECVVSYKKKLRWKEDPSSYVSIAVFHGKPNPHQELDKEWVREHWR